MRRLIVKSLETIAYGGIGLLVLGLGAAGAGTVGGIGGFLLGAVLGAVVSIVLFGALFLLIDIAENTRRSTQLLEGARPDGPEHKA